MCWSILLKDTISRPFHSSFAQNSYKWKRGENACTQELVKLWHATVEEQTLERPSAQHALLAVHRPSTAPSPWWVEVSPPGLPWCRVIPLSSACCHCTHGLVNRLTVCIAQDQPCGRQCGHPPQETAAQLARDRAKRDGKEGALWEYKWAMLHCPSTRGIPHQSSYNSYKPADQDKDRTPTHRPPLWSCTPWSKWQKIHWLQGQSIIPCQQESHTVVSSDTVCETTIFFCLSVQLLEDFSMRVPVTYFWNASCKTWAWPESSHPWACKASWFIQRSTQQWCSWRKGAV